MKSYLSLDNQISVDVDIIEIFENMVDSYPTHVAVEYQGLIINYQALNIKINLLAHYLKNILKDTHSNQSHQAHIGIKGFNKLNIIISQLACLKIGVAYVVIGNDVSSDNMTFIVEDAALVGIINCDSSADTALSSSVRQYNMNDIITQNTPANKNNLNLHFDPDIHAYIIYTSGSTGRPKGVLQSRRGIVGQIKHYSEALDISPADRIINISPLTHDQGMANVYSALLNGSGLYIHDVTNNNYQEVVSYIKNNKISIYVSVPSVWKQVAGIGSIAELNSLRLVRLGGEESTIEHAQLYQKKCQDKCKFITAYGASECSFISLYTVTKETDLSKLNTLPMGLLLEHIAYKEQPVNDGSDHFPFIISSPYMALGYTNADENSKAYSFFENQKYYTTGDRVKIENNLLNFMGREAWHEKIQGNRVNLYGIENSIKKIINKPECDCIVVAIGEGDQKKLIACIAGTKIDTMPLLQALKKSGLMETYAIPYNLIYIDALPRLNNNKIDRNSIKKLAESALSEQETTSNEIQSVDDLIKNIRTIISNVLIELHSLNDINDNEIVLTEVGLNSIIATQLTRQINVKISSCILKQSENEVVQILQPMDMLYRCNNLEEYKQLVARKINEHLEIQYNVNINKNTSSNVPYATRSFYARMGITGNLIYKNLFYMFDINFAGMNQLVQYISKVNNITITLCRGLDDFIESIVNTITSLPPNYPYEYGFITPTINEQDAHRVACILSYNNDKKNWDLFISDSLGLSGGIHLGSLVTSKMQDVILSQLNIYIDPIWRQNTDSICNIDALLVIKNGLNGAYRDNIYINQEKIGNIIFFINPPKCLQGYEFDILDYLCGLMIYFNINLKLPNHSIDDLFIDRAKAIENYLHLDTAALKNQYDLGDKLALLHSKLLNTLKNKLTADYLKDQLIKHLTAINNMKLAKLIGDSVKAINKNTQLIPFSSYPWSTKFGIKNVTTLDLNEEPSECQLQLLSPHNIILKYKKTGILIFWKKKRGDEGYQVKEWQYINMPKEIIDSIDSMLKKKATSLLFEKCILNEINFHWYEFDYDSNNIVLKPANTYYCQSSPFFYKIIFHGKQLMQLQDNLENYLQVLIDSKKNNNYFFNKKANLALINKKINTVYYLMILFEFKNADKYPFVQMHVNEHAKILFGSGQQKSDKTINHMLQTFIAALDGDFYFFHINMKLNLNLNQNNAIKSLVQLFQDEYNFIHDIKPNSSRSLVL